MPDTKADKVRVADATRAKLDRIRFSQTPPWSLTATLDVLADLFISTNNTPAIVEIPKRRRRVRAR